MSSQSQSQSPNQNQKQFDMRNWFPPYPPPSSSSAAGDNFFPYPPPPPPPPPEPHANIYPHPYPHGPHRLLPYTPPPTTTVVSPNAGPQILALLNNNKSKHVGSTAPIYGKRVFGDYVAYDVDAVEEGREPTQQLEVNPITKYGSDPELLIGRQIAVNKHYVCYGLKGGNVRVLNLNTATRSLLRGHTKVYSFSL